MNLLRIEEGAELLSPTLQNRRGERIPQADTKRSLDEIESALRVEFPTAALIYRGGSHIAVHITPERRSVLVSIY